MKVCQNRPSSQIHSFTVLFLRGGTRVEIDFYLYLYTYLYIFKYILTFPAQVEHQGARKKTVNCESVNGAPCFAACLWNFCALPGQQVFPAYAAIATINAGNCYH